MKSKSLLMLLELAVMILVFSIAAALCLKAFVASDKISKKSLVQDEAVILAQNTAEMLKHNHGDLSAVEEYIKKELSDQPDYELRILPLEPKTPYLGKAEISVFFEGESVFSFITAWQEVIENE